jgi:hypothetical protein
MYTHRIHSTPTSLVWHRWLAFGLACALILSSLPLSIQHMPPPRNIGTPGGSAAIAAPLAAPLDMSAPPQEPTDLPIAFVPNVGQTNPSVLFQTHAMGGSVFFTQQEVLFSLPITADTATDTQAAVLRLQFEGANATPAIAGGVPLPGVVNYLHSTNADGWQTNIPTYQAIHYRQIYPGIDLRYDGLQGTIKSTYTVAPHANPQAIRWRYQGANKVAVHQTTGDLHIAIEGAATPLVEQAPVAWQTIAGQRIPVTVGYALQGDTVRFVTGSYNPDYPLVIDPALSYTLQQGGSRDEEGYGVTTTSDGSIVMTGSTKSLDFPLTNPLYETSVVTGTTDAFIVKINPSNTVVYSTYLGGRNNDEGRDITTDTNGNVYVTGFTQSADFPIANGLQSTHGGNNDAFVAKISPDGQRLLYSTYLGGNDIDEGYGIAVDSRGRAYVTGFSESPSGFPLVRSLVTQEAKRGVDIFVTKLNPDGSSAAYSTFIVGEVIDKAFGIDIDSSGNAYITGETSSLNLRTTASVITPSGSQPYPNEGKPGVTDAFMIKLQDDGTSLQYSTVYLRGTSNDGGNDIVVDTRGRAYITGWTRSPDFPTTSNRFQGYNSSADAFITIVEANGQSLSYSTFLGGNVDDIGHGITIDSSGYVYVVGETASNDFQEVNPPPQLKTLPGKNGFLTVLDNLQRISYSTGTLGGSDEDVAYDVDVIGNGSAARATVVGTTISTDFPKSSGGMGGSDAFVTVVGSSSLGGDESTRTVAEDVGTEDISSDISISDPSSTNIAINYSVIGCPSASPNTSPAKQGTDFTLDAGQVTIPAGQTKPSTPIEVTILDNDKDEPNREFCVQISSSGGTTILKRYIILDDETTTVFMEGSPQATVNEPKNVGTAIPVEFAVWLENQTYQPVLVPFTVKDISTEAGASLVLGTDYTVESASPINFAPGQNQASITVNVLNPEDVKEVQEQLQITLGEPLTALVWPDGSTTNQPSAVLGSPISDDLIINDTTPLRKVSFAQSIYRSVGETDTTITVVMDGKASQPVHVRFEVTDGAAKAGEDYTKPTETTLTFAPGATEATFVVPILDDRLSETAEDINLYLQNIVDDQGNVEEDPTQAKNMAILGSPQNARLFITNDDPTFVPLVYVLDRPDFTDIDDGRVISPTETLTGTIAPAGDTDTYTFTGRIEQQATITVQASPLVSPTLQQTTVVTPVVEITFGGQTWTSELGADGTVTLTIDSLPASGDYTVVVREANGRTMRYTITVTLQDPTEPEPEPEPEPASKIVYLPTIRTETFTPPEPEVDSDDHRVLVAGMPLEGTITPVGDTDTYSLTGTTGDNIVIQVTGQPLSATVQQQTSVAPAIELFDGTRSWSSEPAINGTALLSATLQTSATHEVRIREISGATMDYSIVMQKIASDTPTPDTEAVPLTMGVPYTGTIETAGMTDTYTFMGSTSQAISIAMQFEEFAYGAASLYAPDGTLVTSAENLSPETTLDVTLPLEGQYRLVVGASERSADYTGNYTITVRERSLLLFDTRSQGILQSYQ